MKIINYKFIYTSYAIFLLALFSFSTSCFSAEFFLKSDTQDFSIGKTSQIQVFIDTKGKNINAIEGKIIYPKDLLEVKSINEGNSIVSLWLEKPKVIKEGEITFSGIVPGGYEESRGLILNISFLSKKEGYGKIQFSNLKVLENDDNGTIVRTKYLEMPLIISKVSTSLDKEISKIEDKNAPEEFDLKISTSTSIFKGKYFIVFVAQDKESGIDFYEVKEGKGKFIKAESPYLLRNQSLSQEIFVKAVDKRGNERIMNLPPQKDYLWYKNYLIIAIIVISLFIIFIKKYVKIF